MKCSSRQLLLSLVFTFVFSVVFTPAAHGVDGCSSVAFKVAANINLEATPFAIEAADFNGDGHLDLVASPNNGLGEVLVLLGRGGTEKFGPPISYPVGGFPVRLATGDFNGDGKPDLVISLDNFGQPGKLSILLNDGTGKFGAPSFITLQGDPIRPVVDDVNNDGKLDIVTALSTGTTDGFVAVLLGNGSGGFSQPPTSPFVTFSATAALLVIGDFNEDGKRDLAVPNSSGGADVLVGDGNGGFALGMPTGITGGSLSLTSGDFNEDGHLDVLVENRMFLGTGTGTFAAPFVVELPENSSAALAGDVNHDGHLDVVSATASGLTIMLGKGTGNLVRGRSYSSGFTVFGAGSSFAVLGDFNEDGKRDLAAVQRSGIGILDGDGTGAFNDALSYRASIATLGALVAADFNNDGKQDFAVTSTNLGFGPLISGVEVALGDGSGGFTRKSVSNFGTSPPRAMAAADFNGDGKLDLAVTTPSNGRITILLNDGTGGFPTAGFSAPNFVVGSSPSAIVTGDFNNDTKADLIAITPGSNSFVVLLGNGSGGFSLTFGGQIQGTFGFMEDVAVADFNADGKSDLAIVRTGENLVNVLQGDGNGQFSAYASLSIPGLPISVVARDLNADGKPDIAVSNSTTDNLSRQPLITVLINNGTGFNSGTSYPTDGAGILRIGDFNSDNHPDLAVSSGAILVGSTLDGIAILTNKGNGTFNAPVNFSAGQVSGDLFVSDFNNDGKDDVVISQGSAQSVALLLGASAPSQQCLSVNDVTITENDSGTVDAVFTVTLSAASAQTVRVNYFAIPANTLFSNASRATKGADFESIPDTVTFLPGQTAQTITIPVKGDLTDEFDQYFFVVLTTPVNAAISDGKGLGTILDNDAPAAISINDVSIAEGTLVQSTAIFTVSLNAPSEKPVDVQFALQAGTASANVDYPNFSGLVDFFPIGSVSKTISVPIIQDNIFEPDETFSVVLNNATNATIADGVGQGTITNDDPQPTISIGSSFRTEGATGTTGNAEFNVTLSNPSFQTITVAFATANATATAGSDYTATSGTITFTPGDISKSITVQVIGDNTDEINETYTVNLTNPTNATIATAQGLGTIGDDDGPTASIGNASVTEGNTGFVIAAFTVTLSAPSVQDIFINYVAASGTATLNIDFQRTSFLSLFIPAGATSGTINMRVFGDFVIEPDEQFTVTLQSASNATIGTAQGTGTILNDDSNGKLQFSSQTYSAGEDAGNAVITVSRVDGATGTVTVEFATSNGTATAGSDYTATSGTLTFNQGEISKTFSIPILVDSVFEGDETVNLTLSNATGGATLGNPTTATLTIKSPSLFLALEESALDPNRVAALDSLWFLRDPFSLTRPMDLLNPGPDLNTRVSVFVTNLQIGPGDVVSTVRVHLVDANSQTHDIGAENVSVAPFANFVQVTFRLPDNLPPGVCNIKIKSHDQESNSGTIRIKN